MRRRKKERNKIERAYMRFLKKFVGTTEGNNSTRMGGNEERG
jgi:hypothetical protein